VDDTVSTYLLLCMMYVGALMHYKGAISPSAILPLQGVRANDALVGNPPSVGMT
jgi:hypothetical protein